LGVPQLRTVRSLQRDRVANVVPLARLAQACFQFGELEPFAGDTQGGGVLVAFWFVHCRALWLGTGSRASPSSSGDIPEHWRI
jgi:hypothetical protein